MTKRISLSLLAFFICAQAHAESVSHTCTITKMKNSVTPDVVVATATIEYPQQTRPTKMGFNDFQKGHYVNCGYDNRFEPLQLSCNVRSSKNLAAVTTVSTDSKSKMINMYGAIDAQIGFNVSCETVSP